jgi:type IV secretory pathway TraG/TraD family ATPase VirD4
MDPKPTWIGDYRAHFYSPEKNFFGLQMSTFLFNMIIIWLMTLVLYIALYFEWLRKAIKLFENVSFSNKVKSPKAVSSKKK